MWKWFASIALGCCAFAGVASADSVTATLTTVDPYAFVNIVYNGTTYSGGAGALRWTGVATNPTSMQGTFSTYCIDIVQDVYFGQSVTYDVMPLSATPIDGPTSTGMGPIKAQEIQELWGQHYADTLGSTIDKEENRVAFQMAIWNIVFDNDASISFGNGSFYFAANPLYSATDPLNFATLTTTANTWLTEALALPTAANYATNLISLSSVTFQDQIGTLPGPVGALPTPLPAAWAGCGLLLSGFAVSRRLGLRFA